MKRAITAAMLAATMVLGVVPGVVVASHTFTDVADSNIFHDDIAWLAEADVTRGCNPPDNTEFCPDDNVTREQMAAFMHRLNNHLLDESAANTPGPLAHQLAAANLATAQFQDVEMAESAGYVSTIDALGCFESPSAGGMGLHYLNESLLDASVDATRPEALVYELDHNGDITELVALEYIVPVEAWDESHPPSLFGQHFHQHPVLPLYVLHAWIWKDNPSGMFEDFNPKVRMCPDGVPVFGTDLP